MSEFALPPLGKDVPRTVREAFETLENYLNSAQHVGVREYLDADKPAATDVPPGTVIFVSDASAKFQGSDGSAWLDLS